VDVDADVDVEIHELYLNVAKLGEEDGHGLVMTGRVK